MTKQAGNRGQRSSTGPAIAEKPVKKTVKGHLPALLKYLVNRWTVAMGIVSVLLLLPIIFIFTGLFRPGNGIWRHLAVNVLPEYVANSLTLLLGTGICTILLGVSSAWAVSNYSFPGKKWFEWLLILPLSIPTYIAAFTYAGIFDPTGGLQDSMRSMGLVASDSSIDIMHMPMMIMILSVVLYPYVYLICRSTFIAQSRQLIEAARSLGRRPTGVFFSVVLPLARPAIIGGVVLVMMEVLNDYGAVKYFGIPTFTTGIFRAWFALGDTTSAIRLSACLLVFVVVLIIVERINRGDARYSEQSSGGIFHPMELRGVRSLVPILVCLIPLTLGFIFPMTQLILWAIEAATGEVSFEFVQLVINSFLLAAGAAIICVCISILIAYTRRIFQAKLIRYTAGAAVLGYAIPGAVIAVGVMVPFVSFNAWLNTHLFAPMGISAGLFLNELFITILFAYSVRFLAVAYNPIESGLERVTDSVDEAARSLGRGPWATLRGISLPLIKAQVLTSFILVFVDVLKELPLTLILRPFNFDSLATRTYELASDERIAESAFPALMIVATGLIPIIVLNHLLKKNIAR